MMKTMIQTTGSWEVENFQEWLMLKIQLYLNLQFNKIIRLEITSSDL